jgi:hypothetical protein
MLGKCNFCSVEFKYCSNICQQQFQQKQRIDEWLSGGRPPGKKSLKKYLSETFGYKCSCCNISEWNNKPLSLEIDHKDGNPYNNDISNLRYICPNCHSQTPTYKGKNKGNGRLERRDRARLDFHRQKICL